MTSLRRVTKKRKEEKKNTLKVRKPSAAVTLITNNSRADFSFRGAALASRLALKAFFFLLPTPHLFSPSAFPPHPLLSRLESFSVDPLSWRRLSGLTGTPTTSSLSSNFPHNPLLLVLLLPDSELSVDISCMIKWLLLCLDASTTGRQTHTHTDTHRHKLVLHDRFPQATHTQSAGLSVTNLNKLLLLQR